MNRLSTAHWGQRSHTQRLTDTCVQSKALETLHRLDFYPSVLTCISVYAEIEPIFGLHLHVCHGRRSRAGGRNGYSSVPPNKFPVIYILWLLHAPVLYALEYTKSSTHFQKFPRIHKRHRVQIF